MTYHVDLFSILIIGRIQIIEQIPVWSSGFETTETETHIHVLCFYFSVKIFILYKLYIPTLNLQLNQH